MMKETKEIEKKLNDYIGKPKMLKEGELPKGKRKFNYKRFAKLANQVKDIVAREQLLTQDNETEAGSD